MKQKQILSLAIISLLIISTPNTLTSQTEEGNWLAEGNLGNINLSNNKNESTYGTNTSKSENQGYYISLYPRIGYFISDNFVLGTTLNFSYQSNKYKSYSDNGVKSRDEIYNRSGIGLSPFLRYYFTENSKNRLYGQLGGGINNYKSTSNTTLFNYLGDINGTEKMSGKEKVISGEVLIGFNHFFTENVAFNSSIGYGYGYGKRTYNYTYGGINSLPQETKYTTGNVIWNFGFTIIIAIKKDETN